MDPGAAASPGANAGHHSLMDDASTGASAGASASASPGASASPAASPGANAVMMELM